MPTFAASGGGDIHHAIRQQMREAVMGNQMPVYLDAEAKEMLSDARKAAEGMGIGANPFVQHGKTLFWFTWAGSAINRTLTALARYGADLRCWDAGIAIGFDKAEVEDVRRVCAQFVEAPTSAEELALTFPIKATEKYDEYLDDDLQVMLMAESLDVDGAIGVAKKGLQPKHE